MLAPLVSKMCRLRYRAGISKEGHLRYPAGKIFKFWKLQKLCKLAPLELVLLITAGRSTRESVCKGWGIPQ